MKQLHRDSQSSATAVAHQTTKVHPDSCSCGHDHSREAHGHSPDPVGEGCACSSHSHDSGSHEAADSGGDDEPEHCSCAGGSCSAGHSHSHDEGFLELDGCGCDHCAGEASGKPENKRRDLIEIAGSVLIAAVAFFFVSNPIAQAVLVMASILLVGRGILWSGAKSIAKLDFNELALMSIAVVAACVIGEHFEALLVTVLFRIGEMLEDAAVAHSRREVEAITKIIPDNANLVAADGSVSLISARRLSIGDTILIKSGERVPVDCSVLEGSSTMDTSSLTGESAPRDIAPGDQLLSGMVNLGGVLTCRAAATFDNSTASRIIKMVKESASQKGRTEKLISRFARIYTPIVILAAVVIAALPPLLGFGAFSMWLSRSLVFLVASCPCALVIATPLSYFAGIGAASKQGVLVKGSKYLEVLAAADTVVMDKTGTLTTGKLTVGRISAAAGASGNEVLALAAACERYSNHPIAKAVAEAASGLSLPDADSVEEITSYGMSAQIGGRPVLCGSARLMERFGVDISAAPAAALYVAADGVLAGTIQVTDTPRPDAADTIRALKAQGVGDVVMLTGDSRAAAEETARAVGITRVEAELLPQDKVAAFDSLKAKATGKVLFVGDGINDSPVLAKADAGVAMGIGADAAIESADVVLLSDRLSSLPQAIRIARRTGRLARFNITFALAVKLIVFVLAVFGYASMWMAVFADVGVTVLAVLNAARALRYK